MGARANPAYNLTFDVRLYGADPNANCCAEAAIQAAINASGQNYAGDYNCGEGCATWGPPVVFPHGQYAINSTLTPAGVMRGEGNAMIRMLDPSKDIFYSPFTWRRKRTHPQPPSPTHAAPTYALMAAVRIENLRFHGGLNQLHLGTNDIDCAFWVVRDCVFSVSRTTIGRRHLAFQGCQQ